MRKYVLSIAAALALCFAVLAAPEKESRLVCTLTNQEVASCCCEVRDGKLFCTKAQKEIRSCCCKPVKN